MYISLLWLLIIILFVLVLYLYRKAYYYRYYGTIFVKKVDGKTIFSLEVGDPEEIYGKDSIVFKVLQEEDFEELAE